MDTPATLTEAEILSELVEPHRSFSRQVAQELLSLKFNDIATTRICELLQRNNAGTITSSEKSTLENYLRVGEFLDLMQAKARQSLQQSESAM